MKKVITTAAFITVLSAPAFGQVVEDTVIGGIGADAAGIIPFVLMVGLVGLAASASD